MVFKLAGYPGWFAAGMDLAALRLSVLTRFSA